MVDLHTGRHVERVGVVPHRRPAASAGARRRVVGRRALLARRGHPRHVPPLDLRVHDRLPVGVRRLPVRVVLVPGRHRLGCRAVLLALADVEERVEPALQHPAVVQRQPGLALLVVDASVTDVLHPDEHVVVRGVAVSGVEVDAGVRAVHHVVVEAHTGRAVVHVQRVVGTADLLEVVVRDLVAQVGEVTARVDRPHVPGVLHHVVEVVVVDAHVVAHDLYGHVRCVVDVVVLEGVADPVEVARRRVGGQLREPRDLVVPGDVVAPFQRGPVATAEQDPAAAQVVEVGVLHDVAVAAPQALVVRHGRDGVGGPADADGVHAHVGDVDRVDERADGVQELDAADERPGHGQAAQGHALRPVEQEEVLVEGLERGVLALDRSALRPVVEDVVVVVAVDVVLTGRVHLRQDVQDLDLRPRVLRDVHRRVLGVEPVLAPGQEPHHVVGVVVAEVPRQPALGLGLRVVDVLDPPRVELHRDVGVLAEAAGAEVVHRRHRLGSPALVAVPGRRPTSNREDLRRHAPHLLGRPGVAPLRVV